MMGRTLAASMLTGLVLSGAVSPQPHQTPSEQWPPAAFMLGKFDDDYGSTHVVTREVWMHGKSARYEIVRWNAKEQYLIAHNAATNPSEAGLWSRFDWMPLENMPPFTWAFCMSAYKAESFEEAEKTTIAKRDAPKTGCNGFPFTRMKKLG
jgi:hypothetical protein